MAVAIKGDALLYFFAFFPSFFIQPSSSYNTFHGLQSTTLPVLIAMRTFSLLALGAAALATFSERKPQRLVPLWANVADGDSSSVSLPVGCAAHDKRAVAIEKRDIAVEAQAILGDARLRIADVKLRT